MAAGALFWGARHLSAICFTYLDAKMTIELHSSKDESEGGETLREKFLKKIAGDLQFQQAEKSGQAFVLGTCTLKIANLNSDPINVCFGALCGLK